MTLFPNDEVCHLFVPSCLLLHSITTCFTWSSTLFALNQQQGVWIICHVVNSNHPLLRCQAQKYYIICCMLTCNHCLNGDRHESICVFNSVFRCIEMLYWVFAKRLLASIRTFGVLLSSAENSISRIASGRETVGLAFMNAMVFWARGSTWTLTIDILGVCRYKIAQHLLGGYDVIINLTHSGGFGRRDFFW